MWFEGKRRIEKGNTDEKHRFAFFQEFLRFRSKREFEGPSRRALFVLNPPLDLYPLLEGLTDIGYPTSDLKARSCVAQTQLIKQFDHGN